MSVERICFVSLPVYGFFNAETYDLTGGGGAKRQIYLLTQELKTTFDIHVVVGDYGQPKIEHRDGVTLHRAYTPNTGGQFGKFRALFDAMRRADADVYVYRGDPRKAAVTGLLARILRRKWVYNVANDADLECHYESCQTPIRWLFRRGLARSHAIIAQTDHQRRQLRDRFGLESTVVPNGYPTVEVDPPSDREYVLWVGRLEPEQKRPGQFLACAQALPNVSFRLVGVPVEEACHRQVRRRSAQLDNLEFIPGVEPDAIHEQYRHAIALVNTSAYEGFPNTFLEAWRQETPVVSLDVDPGRYLGADCYTGYANGDIGTLEESIRTLVDDPERRQTIGQRLREYVHAHYEMGVVARQYAEALQSPPG